MTYEQWREKTDLNDIAKEMGYEWAEDMPAQLSIHIQHRLAEMWIAYKADELILA